MSSENGGDGPVQESRPDPVFLAMTRPLSLFVFLLTVTVTLAAQTPALPPVQKRATPQAVVDEHVDALNKCDWKRLMAQYPDDVEILMPAGQVVKGRAAVAAMFQDFVKAPKDGGLCGLTFKAEHVFAVGNTVNVQWVATAPFLAEPYKGADAYVTRDGLMAAQVTTFDGAELKKK
jgi:hypothetical protein